MDLIDWQGLWNFLFGTQEFLGVNMGFWAVMFVSALIVVAMNLVCWLGFKPFDRKYDQDSEQ